MCGGSWESEVYLMSVSKIQQQQQQQQRIKKKKEVGKKKEGDNIFCLGNWCFLCNEENK